jgi:beta-lactam-binding protein with PASTA domain
MIHFHRNSFVRFQAVVAVATFYGLAGVSTALAQATLDLPSGSPAAVVKSILIDDREVLETDKVQPQATLTRGGQTVRLVSGVSLYKGDVIETKPKQNAKVTVLFLDEPMPARDNEIIIYPESKVGIGSSDSWWGRVWAKVKDAFSSNTSYARLSARGTEYDLYAIKDQQRAILTVIEGVVDVQEGSVTLAGPSPSPTPEFETLLRPSPGFLYANFLTPLPQPQFGRDVKLRVGEMLTVPLTYNIHNECLQTHHFEFRTSDSTPWFSLIGEKNFDVPGPKKIAHEEGAIKIDATNLAPGLYEAHVYAICLDCQTERGCDHAQLDWRYRITVEPAGTATANPSPTPVYETFAVNEGEEAPISSGHDVVQPAPTPDLQAAVTRASETLIGTQPSYSAQNLIPHFATLELRNLSFTSARQQALVFHKAGSQAILGNVYSDWGQGAWALYAYDKNQPAGIVVLPASLSIDRAEALRLTGQLDAAAGLPLSNADTQLPETQNLLGNIALDRARVAWNGGDVQEAKSQANEAITHYNAAASVFGKTPVSGPTGISAVNSNFAEANILIGDLALQSDSAPEAKDRFEKAADRLKSIQSTSVMYPFPVTNLGVVYRGLGDAAVLSGDLKAATDGYANARLQHEQAIRAHPDFAEAYFNLGDLYDDLGDRENAKLNYRRAIQTRPEQPAAYLPLAILIKDEDPALARALAQTYLKLERPVFLRGLRRENAQSLADGKPEKVNQPRRIGERIGGVPNLIGQNQSDAEKMIANAGYRLGTIETRVGTGAVAIVVQQSPTPGTKLSPGSAINLVIDKTGKTIDELPVPILIGKTRSEANQAIATAGFKIGSVDSRDSGGPADVVLDQTPAPATQAPRGSAIDIVVSKSIVNQQLIPDVIGKSEEEARSVLEQAGYKVGSLKHEGNTTQPKGSVFRQDPRAGERKNPGTKVKLFISLGRLIKVPRFEGESEDSARSQLNANSDLILGTVEHRESCDRIGVVIDQKPDRGKEVEPGTSVDLVVGSVGDDPVMVPNFVGKNLNQVEGEIKQLGLSRGLVINKQTNQSAEGTVLSQSRGPGELPRKCQIDLTVAAAPPPELVPVPDLCGRSLQEARNILSSPKFGLVNTDQDLIPYNPNAPACGQVLENRVMAQDPLPNTKIPKGSRVRLMVAPIQ